MRRKWPGGNFAASTVRVSRSRCVCRPTCSLTQSSAASIHSISARRTESMRPFGFTAICSSWVGSGQKPSSNSWGVDGANRWTGVERRRVFGFRGGVGLAGRAWLGACVGAAGSHRRAGELPERPGSSLQANRSRSCMAGIVDPAQWPRNSPDYGSRFRAITEAAGRDALPAAK